MNDPATESARTGAAAGAAPSALGRDARRSVFSRLARREPLAIDGLPASLASLGAGQVHVVYADASPARDALFWQTSAAALAGPATVLSTRDAASLAATLRDHGVDIDKPGSTNAWANVCALQQTPERAGRDGAQVLIEALNAIAAQCAAPESQFFIEGAEVFFNWQDAAALAGQGAQLASWCAQYRYGVLMVVAPPGLDDDREHPELAAFQARFAGAAQLHQVQGQYRWEVAFWRAGDAVHGSQSVPLRFSAADHRLTVSGGTFESDIGEAGLLAPDEGRVIVSRDAMLHERVLPPAWQIVDNNEAAVAAARTSVAATVILDFSVNRDLETLAEQVHTLRLQCGEALKIIVREDAVAMRYESLMLNLGANRVIARQTPLAQVEAIVDSLQGQVYSRPMLADYRTALAAVVHGEESGYVGAAHFVELVRAAVERSRVIQLPSVLIRLALMPEIAHVDALKACQLRRAGDIVTASGDSLYVFFFACRLSDADAVLLRVFKRPLAELFQGEERYGDGRAITDMLDTLDDEIDATPPPDYSGWLALNAEQPSAPASVAAHANGQTVPTAAGSPATSTAPAAPVTPPEPAAPGVVAAASGGLLPALNAVALNDSAKPRAVPRRAPLPLKA
jgi:cellulose biosynthesis protein BcsE